MNITPAKFALDLRDVSIARGSVLKGAEAQTNETLPVVILRPSRRPILEKSMLGKRGQQLCQDVDTFWILSSCNPSVGQYIGE